MVSDLDIYRTANALIKQHGDAAPLEAAMKADKMLVIGDMDGKAVWLRVLNAVEQILKKTPTDGDSTH